MRPTAAYNVIITTEKKQGKNKTKTKQKTIDYSCARCHTHTGVNRL